MPTPDQLARAFARNAAYLGRAVAGIDHSASLLQPPAPANCLNWTVGHVVHYRDVILELLDRPPVGGEGELDRYRQESEPIRAEGPGVVRFERLLELLETGQGQLAEALTAVSEERLAEPMELGERTTTRGSRVFFYYFHDTLHIGQADVLAELSR